jgi:hypothetical protein
MSQYGRQLTYPRAFNIKLVIVVIYFKLLLTSVFGTNNHFDPSLIFRARFRAHHFRIVSFLGSTLIGPAKEY